jgi:hypothetical protein
MACINVHTQDVIGSCLSSIVTRIGSGLSVDVSRVTNPLRVSAVDSIKEHLKARASIVCSISEVVDFLRVTPTEIQWITDDMGVFFDVESNVDWIIVTS